VGDKVANAHARPAEAIDRKRVTIHSSFTAALPLLRRYLPPH